MTQLKFNTNVKALLDKTKGSTIRKAYHNRIASGGGTYCRECQSEFCRKIPPHERNIKPCKYKVGEIYEAVWTGYDNDSIESFIKRGDILGNVKITSIEKIEIGKLTEKDKKLLRIYGIAYDKYYISHVFGSEDAINNLSEKEGFESVKEMFEFFEEYVPEIKNKPMFFWLIGFEWVNEG